MASQKITSQAIAYLKGSPLEDGRPVIELSHKESPVIRPFLDELHICYLVDDRDFYKYIQNYHLDEDGITADELHEIGLRNLRRLIHQRDTRVQPYASVFAFLAGGDFEGSVMLLDELWDGEFRKFVKGEYAVAVPTRDVLAFCDATSNTGISELMDVVNRTWPSGDHLISNKIYVRHSSMWKALQ